MGEWLVIGLVFELAGIDAQLARRKLGKKIHPDHGGRQRPTAAMVTPPRRRVIRQSPNEIRDKSMSLKLDSNVVLNILALFKGAAHRRRPAKQTLKYFITPGRPYGPPKTTPTFYDR